MNRFKFKLFALTWVLILAQTLLLPTVSRSLSPVIPAIPQANPTSITAQAKTQPSPAALEAADRLFQQGLEQFNQQQIDVAIASWQQALAAYQALTPKASEPPSEPTGETILTAIAATQQNLLAAYLQQDRIDDAIALLPQQAQVQQRLGKASAAASADYRLANLYAQQGRYREAIAPYERSLAYAQAHDSYRLPVVLGNLAIAYKNTGQYLKALEANQTAIKQLREQENQPLLRRVLGNQGNVYQVLGDYDQAQSSFEAALQLAEQLGDQPGQALLWNNLGGLAANQGDLDKAVEAYRQSIEMAEASDSQNSLGRAWLNLGDVSHQQRALDEAIADYQKSLKIAEALGDRQLQAEALGSLGVAFDSQQQYDRAVEHLQRSLEISRQMGDRPRESLTLNNLGHALYAAGKLDDAEETLRSVLQVLDELRLGLSDLDKVSLFDTQAKTYLLLQQVLIAQGRTEDALEISEWGRGRAFADLLVQRGRGLAGGETRMNQAIAQTLTQAAKPPPLEELRRVARSRNSTIVEYTLIPQSDFVHQGKQLGNPEAIYIWVIQPDGQVHFRQSDLTSLTEANQSLNRWVQQSRCFAPAAVCRRRLRAVSVRTQSNTIQSNRQRGAAIAPEPGPLYSQSGSSDSRFARGEIFRSDDIETVDRQARSFPALQKLHGILIDPIADLLPQSETEPVLLIPQGSLFLVPFAALQDAAGEFLIANHTLLTAPSIQTLLLTEARDSSPSKSSNSQPSPIGSPEEILLVGNPVMPKVTLRPGQPPKALSPLPGSEAEVKAIAQTLGATPLIGDQATKTQVLQTLPQSRWVHLATHGLLDYAAQSQQQIPGALALTPENATATLTATPNESAENPSPLDGLLTADEIIDLDLKAELVVLSACDTGRGNLTGDGVVGLSRAWMGAGVPSLVVSLWAVSDESTSVLMQHFYQFLSQGTDKATALRQAILITAEDYPSPHDWAAFTLVGEAG